MGCQSAEVAPDGCDLKCGDHEICTVRREGLICECVVGYERRSEDGGKCVWGGGIVDPGFAIAEEWETRGARVAPLSGGDLDIGIAAFEETVTCEAGAVWQIVDMPPYDEAQPFIVRVHYRMSLVNGVDVGYGRAFRRLRPKNPWPAWSDAEFCLGEDGYGGPVKFQVAATERTPDCFISPEGTIEVDRFEIAAVDPGDCPPLGEALNGDADLSGAPWDLAKVSGTEAGLVELNGRSVARIARSGGPAPGNAAMSTPLSVRLASELPSPALRFWWEGQEDWWYNVSLGTFPGLDGTNNRPLDTLVGTGSEETATYCLPPWTHGNVADLWFQLAGGPPDVDAWLNVDDIEIISDPGRCGNDTDVLDPGFDASPYRWPGVDVLYQEEAGSGVRLVNGAVDAEPPGDGVLEIRYATNKTRLDVHTWVWVPKPDGDALPRLYFRSKVPADEVGLPVFWVLGAVSTSLDLQCVEELCSPIPLKEKLPVGLGWQGNAPCLPVEWAERWYRLRISIRPSDEPMQVYEEPRTVLLDNFEVVLDEGCPDPR